ncbi:MAG TPA: sigma-54 dependent transcriptional regulator, partial [Planctomycetota bacterium]|nr:sigma-54 dependent transcriptional regulator [Planctomycetota bacterium]
MTDPAAPSPSVLVLDPDVATGRELEAALRAAGCEVTWLRDAAVALRRLEGGTFEVAVVDEAAARAEKLLEECRRPERPAAIVVSSFGTVAGAVEAMREGAIHYASKPIAADEIVLAVRQAAEQRRLRRENRELRDALERRSTLGALVVRDARMREIFSLVETVAQTRATVLLLGESGTGKSVLARAIHAMSPRRAGPFVEVSCGALPETLLESELFGHAKGAYTGALRDRAGRFEVASGGTIFLDEIATASKSLQVRLLQVLQERVVQRVGETKTRPVDVRVVLATNGDLATEVREGRFREDLYYRIHVVAIELPPLRDRRSDIPELARAFLERADRALDRDVRTIAPEAMDRLLAHGWPGNVRELENAIEHAVAVGRGPELRAADLPVDVGRVVAPAPPSDAAAQGLDDVPLGPIDEMLAAC